MGIAQRRSLFPPFIASILSIFPLTAPLGWRRRLAAAFASRCRRHTMKVDKRRPQRCRNGPRGKRQLMSKQLMRIVLPRLARRLQLQLERYRSGRLNDAQFTNNLEVLRQDEV